MPQIDIKINSLADLKGFLDTTRAAKETQKATESFGSFLRSGLGIGTGIEVARRGFELFKAAVVDTAKEAFNLASEVKDGAEALGISRQAYQVLGEVMREVGGSQERMTQAIAANNRALVEARSLVGPAAAAFRTLGLDPAQLEGLSVQRRLQVIGAAIDGAKDKTEAFAAAGDILGSKNLPTLLNALRILGTEGYDKLAENAEKAGRVMSDDTIDRLDNAQKAIEKFKRSITIGVGESIAAVDKVKDSFKADAKNTSIAGLMSLLTGNTGFVTGAASAILNEPKKAPVASEDPETLASAAANAKAIEDRANAQLDAERDLTKAKLDQSRVDSDNKAGVLLKSSLTLQNIEKEFSARKRIIDLLESSPITDKETPQSRETKLIQLRTENALLLQKKNILETGPRSAADEISERARGVNDPRVNPNSLTFGEGVRAAPQQRLIELGSTGEQVAQTLNTAFSGATSGLATAFEGLINQTQTWGQFLRNIWVGFGQLATQAFAKMAADYIVQKGVMFAADALFATKSLALSVASAAKSLVAWIPAAIAASISSYGVAAAIGLAAAVAAVAFSGGFADGGFTSSGPKNKPAGIVHAGEWVSPAWMVNSPRFGPMIGMLEAARTGAAGFLEGGLVDSAAAITRPAFQPNVSGGGNFAAAQGDRAERPMNFFAYYDLDELKRAVRDAEGDVHIINVIGKNRDMLGI